MALQRPYNIYLDGMVGTILGLVFGYRTADRGCGYEYGFQTSLKTRHPRFQGIQDTGLGGVWDSDGCGVNDAVFVDGLETGDDE